MTIKTRNDSTGLDQLDPTTHPARDAEHFRRILAARKAIADAEQELHDAVKAARAAGEATPGPSSAPPSTLPAKQLASDSAATDRTPRAAIAQKADQDVRRTPHADVSDL